MKVLNNFSKNNRYKNCQTNLESTKLSGEILSNRTCTQLFSSLMLKLNYCARSCHNMSIIKLIWMSIDIFQMTKNPSDVYLFIEIDTKWNWMKSQNKRSIKSSFYFIERSLLYDYMIIYFQYFRNNNNNFDSKKTIQNWNLEPHRSRK